MAERQACRENRLRGRCAGRMMRPNQACAKIGTGPPLLSLPKPHLGSSIMPRPLRNLGVIFALLLTSNAARGDEPPKPPDDQPARVYGEWRIRVRPDQGPAYDALIEKSGLPLFRQAGGRMVGWWKTSIGDLYEHVTIWEYDDMAAFEKAGQFLGKNADFGWFVAARDPLLSGEESRFLRLAAGGMRPTLPEPAPFVVHETHRVPLAKQDAYLNYMSKSGLALLKAHGFRPVGPLIVEVGRWSEITYLFSYESLAERERKLVEFRSKPDAAVYRQKLSELTDDVISRLLFPAAFAKAPASAPADKPVSSAAPLPHREEIAPGVHAAGFADRYHSSNCGWVALSDETLLVDLPRGMPVREFLKLVAGTTGKPARTLVLTRVEDGDWPIIAGLREQGVARILTSPALRARLAAAGGAVAGSAFRELGDRTAIGDRAVAVDFLPLDQSAGQAGGAVHVKNKRVLFAGPLVVHGPRAALAGIDTGLWAAALRRLQKLDVAHVVPAIGTWGGPEVLERQQRFLTELRRQVSYEIAQGRPHAGLTGTNLSSGRLPGVDTLRQPDSRGH